MGQVAYSPVVGSCETSRPLLSPAITIAAGCATGTALVYVTSKGLAYKIAAGILTASASSAAFVGLYIIKSAVGIDLFPGPSFMHDTFYIF